MHQSRFIFIYYKNRVFNNCTKYWYGQHFIKMQSNIVNVLASSAA